MDLDQIPDYAALKQLQEALWGVGETRGAAVLVGAGFSRNAELPAGDSPQPPLWTDFHKEMIERLYPNGDGPQDTLRLAEEYRAALGEQALEGLIHDLVRNAEWQPGRLHQALVRLPWSDILTTNWDTLLERAADTTFQQSYDIVRTIPDMARARAPRIVKLHGSLPSNRPFIFTEEDYRTYPRKFAPFVNLVQQVLLENELCLIGFSGDDPNFLQWSGWVRDQLGTAARRIYLIGVLDLLPARRKFLEARNVAPIDLAPVVSNVESADRHAVAAERLLDFLHATRPRPAYDWPHDRSSHSKSHLDNAQDAKVVALNLIAAAEQWKTERETYPGWLVLPFNDRMLLRSHTDIAFQRFSAALEHMKEDQRRSVVFELVWRFDVSLWSAPVWLHEAVEKILTDDERHLTQQQRCTFGLFLTKTAREKNNNEAFEKWQSYLRSTAKGDPDTLAASVHQQCLWHRDHLEYSLLLTKVEQLHGRDPIWKIRNASLRFDLGDTNSAEKLVLEALKDLRDRHTKDRKSIWIISRLAWVTFIANAADIGIQKKSKEDAIDREWPLIFQQAHCDPRDELQALDQKLSEEIRKGAERSRVRQPQFDAGSYRDHSDSVYFDSWTSVSAADEIRRIVDIVGLPAQAQYYDIMGSRASRAAELSNTSSESDLLTCVRSLRDHEGDLMEKHFGRVEVARISAELVERISELLWDTIEFGIKRFTKLAADGQEKTDTFWISKVRIHTELLSRFVVRLSSTKAEVFFHRASDLMRDHRWTHWWLFRPLQNLLARSFSTIAPLRRRDLLLDVISLPLPDEHKIRGDENDWPEVITGIDYTLFFRPKSDERFAQRIETLIERVKSGDAFVRERAALILVHLSEAKILNPEENEAFGEALWGRVNPPELFPSDVNLYKFAMLSLPCPNPEIAKRAFELTFLNPAALGEITERNLIEISRATRDRKDRGRLLSLSSEQARLLFNALIQWSPEAEDFDIFANSKNRKIKEMIGATLANAVLPSLSEEKFTENDFQKILALIDSGRAPSALEALPESLRSHPSHLKTITDYILRGLLNRDDKVVFSAFNAVYRWLALREAKQVVPLPTEIADTVFTILTTRREPGLLHALQLAGLLIDAGYLSESYQQRLVETLEALRIETSYDSWNSADPRTTTITLVRARCVRLAQKLTNTSSHHDGLAGWIEDAKTDPMPEVRYALQELDD